MRRTPPSGLSRVLIPRSSSQNFGRFWPLWGSLVLKDQTTEPRWRVSRNSERLCCTLWNAWPTGFSPSIDLERRRQFSHLFLQRVRIPRTEPPMIRAALGRARLDYHDQRDGTEFSDIDGRCLFRSGPLGSPRRSSCAPDVFDARVGLLPRPPVSFS